MLPEPDLGSRGRGAARILGCTRKAGEDGAGIGGDTQSMSTWSSSSGDIFWDALEVSTWSRDAPAACYKCQAPAWLLTAF